MRATTMRHTACDRFGVVSHDKQVQAAKAMQIMRCDIPVAVEEGASVSLLLCILSHSQPQAMREVWSAISDQ